MDGFTAGPDGRPAVFNGAAWISQDGRYWWNGAAWQPVKGRGGFQPPIAIIGVFLVLIAGAWFVVTRVLPPPGATAVVLGVSNAKIDSSTQIELDYARADSCPDLTFTFVFHDKSGKELATYISDDHRNVSANTRHHYVFYTNDSIPAGAVRFDALPTCHS
jgi:hypothetical protein